MESTLPKLLIALIALVTANQQASANIILSLEPASQATTVGGSVSMDLAVSGLNAFAAPGVGAFDVDLTYNPAVLSAVSFTFGSHLDLGVFGSIQSSNLSTPGPDSSGRSVAGSQFGTAGIFGDNLSPKTCKLLERRNYSVWEPVALTALIGRHVIAMPSTVF
jgi:hypothetical protein